MILSLTKHIMLKQENLILLPHQCIQMLWGQIHLHHQEVPPRDHHRTIHHIQMIILKFYQTQRIQPNVVVFCCCCCCFLTSVEWTLCWSKLIDKAISRCRNALVTHEGVVLLTPPPPSDKNLISHQVHVQSSM